MERMTLDIGGCRDSSELHAGYPRVLKGDVWNKTMGCWSRSDSGFTIKLLLACCIALFLLSPALSRHLPSDSRGHMGRSSLLTRTPISKITSNNEGETRRRSLDKREVDDRTGDYTDPTHNQSGNINLVPLGPSNDPVRTKHRRPDQRRFDRYTAHYSRHLK